MKIQGAKKCSASQSHYRKWQSQYIEARNISNLTNLGEQSMSSCSFPTKWPQETFVPNKRDIVRTTTILFAGISEVPHIEKFQWLVLGFILLILFYKLIKKKTNEQKL